MGYPAEPHEPRWSDRQFDAVQDMLLIAALFKPNRLRIDGPLIPVHVLVCKDYADNRISPDFATIIEAQIKALQGIYPSVIIEYVAIEKLRENFQTSKK